MWSGWWWSLSTEEEWETIQLPCVPSQMASIPDTLPLQSEKPAKRSNLISAVIYLALKVKFALPGFPAATVTFCVCLPYSSCQAVTV